MERRYYFLVCITGLGETKREAWDNAVDAFWEAPADPPQKVHREITRGLKQGKTGFPDLEGYASIKEEE